MHEDASTGHFEAPTQTPEYTLWQHPFRDLRIYMHSAALRAVSTRALQSLKSKEPSEIGGILRGSTLAGPKGVTAIIDEAEFVRLEGRFYNATQTDNEAILRALKQQTNQSRLSVVGYFRSHVREDLCLSTADKELITRNIREPNSIFLLVRPFDIGMCMAAFFFWEDGQLQTDGSDFEVPFLALEEPIVKDQILDAHTDGGSAESDNVIDGGSEDKSPRERPPGEAPRGASSQTLRASSFNRASSPEPTPVIQIPLGTQMPTVMASAGEDVMQGRRNGEHSVKQNSSSQTSGKRDGALFALAIAFTFLAVMIAGVYFALPALRSYLLAAPTDSHNTQIGLSVIRAADGQLDLNWRRDAPELARAQGARIAITDGSLYKELNMDNAQLHLGKLTYFPNSPDVQFRLEVYLDSRRSLVESVRVISPASKTTGGGPIFQPGITTKVGPVSVRSHYPSASILPKELSEKFPSRMDSKSRRSFNSDELVSQAPHEGPPPEIPPLSAAELNPSHGSLIGGLPSAPPFPTPPPAAKSATAISQTGNIGIYVPPRPLKKVMPNGIYLGQLQVVYEATEVEVEVNIDATGRVTDAHAVQNGKKASLRLASSAVSAAKQWRFEPATIHGKPIAAGHMLVFMFRPSSQ